MNHHRMFSGVKPSGDLQLGNYLGAIKQWVALQDEYEAIFCVVDLHAVTVPQDPETLRKRTLEFVKAYIALGIDPNKSHIFIQSHVPEHSELAWILNCITKNGDLTKMTQFKDKSGFDFDISIKNIEEMREWIISRIEEKRVFYNDSAQAKVDIAKVAFDASHEVFMEYLQKEVKERFNEIGMGIFDYPVLMASDILLYNTEVVPVGEDQVQHIELARTLARRFNKKFGETFVVPQSRVMKEGARIMGLDDPTKKMSKSAGSEYNFIALDDDLELARKKIMKAVTDSEGTIAYTDDRPGVKNLVTIFALLENSAPEAIVSRYEGKGYADFKKDLAEVVAHFLRAFQEKYNAISDDDARAVLAEGREYVGALAKKKIEEVKRKVGFLG